MDTFLDSDTERQGFMMAREDQYRVNEKTNEEGSEPLYEARPKVELAQGDGGKLTHELVRGEIASRLSNPALDPLTDSAALPLPLNPLPPLSHFTGNTPGDTGASTSASASTTGPRLALTTDSYVVNPIFFPGGDIGRLAVAGTVNDLAVAGARPLYLTLGLIIEAGLSLNELRRVIDSVAATAAQAGVEIVTGDTKVVERGKGDKLYVNTAGVGLIPTGREFAARAVRAGDKVIINGAVGSHGVAVLSSRQGLEFSTPVVSDCAPLSGLIEECLTVVAAVTGGTSAIRVMRDPTRGGLATTLVEISSAAAADIIIDETAILLEPGVQGACDMLGLDPLYLANEGKVIMVVDPAHAETVVTALTKHPLGRDAVIIGEVSGREREGGSGRLFLRTKIGGTRPLTMLTGEPLPRIC